MIDLHIHSTASDGSLSPLEILQRALEYGLEAISITDHDTTNGVRQAFDLGIPQTLEFITGVEVSADPLEDFKSFGSLHILGYGFSVHDRNLCLALEKLRQARADRNPLIIDKLNRLGFDLSLEDVISMSGQVQLGRPHIAQAMVSRGYVPSFDAAFDLYLSKGKPAYVDKFRISCQEAIQLIRDAGGVPVLAHPGLLRDAGQNAIESLIDRLARMGLMGIEVFYTDHSTDETAYFEALAEKRNLLLTGGTDFHGDMKLGTALGRGEGNLSIDHRLFKRLTEEVEALREANPGTEILEANLGHAFNDSALLETALCHSSYVNELPDKSASDNQRLEFLGDAVLGLAVGQMIMETHPDMNEGNLSKLRASLVSETGLAAMARQMDLGRFIRLGKGERLSRGYEKNSILADTFEAVIAAVYLELGFKSTYALIRNLFDPLVETATILPEAEDYKSLLQEYAQDIGQAAPSYSIAGESGPDHDKTFDILVSVCDIETSGSGKSKKSAEQNAAQQALLQLNILKP